jgi:alanine racemase
LSPERRTPGKRPPAGAGQAALRDGSPQAVPAGRAWAEVDLDAVQENVRALLGALSPGTRLMAVVKADAYGHGAPEVARAAVASGAAWLGVATTEEGIELRRAGLDVPVLVLGPVDPGEVEAAVRHDLGLAVFRPETARAASRAAALSGRTARAHLKVDTGMGRIGVEPRDAAALARELCQLPHVQLEGCFTHLATADEEDAGPARAQVEAFRAALAALERAGLRPGVRHAANSAAALALPEAHLDMVRCGIAVYGVAPAPHLRDRVRLRPAMRLAARVAHTKRVSQGTPVGYGWTYRAPRETTIATVPVGYADGYPRLAGPGGAVLCRGLRLSIAGRISMDQMTVDCGDAPVVVGDEVELWGPALPVEEVAARAQTIAYEVLARVSRRVPRVFTERGRVRAVRTLLGRTG